ncbi:MAG: hypothetical protein JWN04_1012 [Myxococcaceae bacterium]|nr:hypothetical protein [Myxococcaceae bacterium]
MRALTVSLLLLAIALSLGCGEDGAAHARRVIRETHAVELKRIVADDVSRHLIGVAAAGARIAPGFAVADPKQRGSQMRTALRLLTKPPKGIPQLIVSARTFTAAVEPSGVVLATDAKPEIDRMTGIDLAKQFAVVRDALAGKTGFAIDQFPAIEQGSEGSVALLFAAVSAKNGANVGAVLTGIPLWRLAQRLTKQLQLDHVSEKGAILWVYLLRGDQLHHFGTPPDLDTMLPSADLRTAQLARSPGGFTGEFLQFGRWYAYGIVPLPLLGPQIAALVVRSDPP